MIDVVANSEDQVYKEVKQRLKDLVEIFEGPTTSSLMIASMIRSLDYWGIFMTMLKST